MNNDIDIKEQESFNEVFCILEKYSHAVIEINDKLEVSFYISKNDLDHNLMIRNAFDSFISYMKLHLRQEERIYSVKATATDDYKHIFKIPKDSKLYELIINYSPSKKSIVPIFAQGGIVNIDKDKIKSIVDRVCDLPEQIISNGQFKKKLDELHEKLITQKFMEPQDLNYKARFKKGDKVKIIKDFSMDIKGELVNLKGFEGFINDVRFDQFALKFCQYNYTIAINEITTDLINESALKLIEHPQKSKYKSGDKVKIIKDFFAFISGENVNLKGFEGAVFSSLNVVSGMYNQNVSTISYDVDVNGLIVGCLQESDLELIQQPQKLEYRADLYDLADDIDGVLLPDSKPSIDFIQRFDK